MYDYLIVGSGIFGSIFAYEMTKKGKKCLVIEKRPHIGGNCFTENKDGINIHKYGPHIFHTDDVGIWNYINQFAEFNNYVHHPKVNYKNKIYSFPINLLTLYQLWGVSNPVDAINMLEKVRVKFDRITNFEEWILSQVGEEIYETFIKGYTYKQWNKHPSELPASIIKRLPIRTNFDDNYFFDRYQGIPIGGYTQIFEKLLSGIEVKLNTDYFANRDYFNSISDKIVFTGRIDEFYDYKFGYLEYRTLRFENQHLEIEDYQGCAQMNFTSLDVPYTRITEHKHFEFSKSKTTWITREYPKEFEKNDVPYYPINDKSNSEMFMKYKKLSENSEKVIFGGRLADYKYYDMHQIIASALTKIKKLT